MGHSMSNERQSLFLRPADLEYLKNALAEGACCSIVGLSNIGKSMLLRTAAESHGGGDVERLRGLQLDAGADRPIVL